MEEKYRDIMEELIYQISLDIYDLLNTEDDIVDAIYNLVRKVEKLSDDMYEDEIVYKCSAGRADLRFNLT